MRHRLLTGMGLVAAVLLIHPRDAAAGFVDFIHEMSGPQMIGVGTTCRTETVRYLKGINLPEVPTISEEDKATRRKFRCSFFGILDGAIVVRERPRRYNWALQPAFYSSTKHNDEETNSRRVYMLGVDPMVNVRSIRRENGFLLEHGVGVSFQEFFVPSADDFARTALKIRLASAEIPIRSGWKLVISHNLRIYADGVGAVDFSPGPKPESRPSETVWKSFSIGLYPG